MILERFALADRVAIVTGAGRGIGAGIARAFAEAGADVVCAARTQSEIERTASEVRACGRRALALRCDVMQAAERENLVRAACDEFGRLDILVNNAGGTPPKPALQTSDADFETALHFNAGTAFAMTRLAAPRMVESAGSGAVINISSAAGRLPGPGFAAYGTAKAALNFMTRELAQDFAPQVRVNAIAAGATRTSALEAVLTPQAEADMLRRTPLRRIGEVEDVAACAIYLASPAAAYVTGEILGVNGGLVALNMQLPRAFE